MQCLELWRVSMHASGRQAMAILVTGKTKHAVCAMDWPSCQCPCAAHLFGRPRLRAARYAQIRRAGMPLDEANYANLIHQASQPGHLGFAVQVRHAFSAAVLPWQAARCVPAVLRCRVRQCRRPFAAGAWAGECIVRKSSSRCE